MLISITVRCVNYHSVLSGVSFEHTSAVSAHANVAFMLNLGWWACHPSIQTNSDYDMAKKYVGFKYRQRTKKSAKRIIQNLAAMLALIMFWNMAADICSHSSTRALGSVSTECAFLFFFFFCWQSLFSIQIL